MSFRINTNIAALNAHTNSLQNNRNLAGSLGKLSSGLRISTAADDASGMTIADSLRSQAMGLGKAIENGNDAIGIVQTADKAMDEQIKILDTIKAKAIQAAQDGQNIDSRKALQADIERLMEELDNIANTTAFNGQQLLNGTYSNKEFQIGAYSNETVKVSIGATNSGRIGATRFESLELSKSSDTGKAEDRGFPQGKVGVVFNNPADGTPSVSTERVKIGIKAGEGLGALARAINESTSQTGVRASADVKFTTDEAIKAGTTTDKFAINGIVIGKISVKDNDSDSTLVNAINAIEDRTGVKASLDKGKLTLSTRDGRAISIEGMGLDATVGGEKVGQVKAEAVSTVGTIVYASDDTEVGNLASKLKINGVEVEIAANKKLSEIKDLIDAKKDDMGIEVSIEDVGGKKALKIVTADGKPDADREHEKGIQIEVLTGDINEKLGLVSKDPKHKEDGESFKTSFDYIGKLNLVRLDGRDIDFKIAVEDGDEVKVEAPDQLEMNKVKHVMSEKTLNLQDVKNRIDSSTSSALGLGGELPAGVMSMKGAQAVIDIAESAQKMLDRIRSDLGSVQNQLVVTINNISVTKVNVTAAESQIRDVDFAAESASFSKFNILAQSGSYAMSQANAVQQNVLRLLQ